jgi:NADPH-dependent 2,4-dienoyl-CoA reductase/sulfur reductase-like enzyme
MNKPEERRPCLRCDAGARCFPPRPLNCAVNPYPGGFKEIKDGIIPKAPVKKRVAVVGGGPAGLYAMMALCQRGHDVTLYEKTGELGGNVVPAAFPPFKIDLQDYLKWLMREAEKYPATILLNTEATKELLDKAAYDAIIIAVGSKPLVPSKIPGIDKPHVHWAPDAEMGKVPAGDKLVIVGGGAVGLEAAIDFKQMGKDVTVVEMLDPVKHHMSLMKSSKHAGDEMLTILNELEIPLHLNNRLEEVKDDKVICKDVETGELMEYPCDTVLLSLGMVPLYDVIDSLRTARRKRRS